PAEAELAGGAAARPARLPSLALRTARSGLGQGPVLVQVPRRGYLAAVACAGCRAQARCATCAGPLEISGSHGTPGCRWCGALAADWSCARCGAGRLRALVTGAARTAEELGRAFPGVPVRTSGGQHVLAAVPAEPALVIATPGAEPVAPGGRAAERAELGVPPAVRMASVTGTPEAVAGFVTAAALPGQAQVLGPVPVEAAAGHPAQEETQERALIRIGRQDGMALARALHAAQAT